MLFFLIISIYIVIAGLVISNQQKVYATYSVRFKCLFLTCCAPLLFVLVFNDSCTDFYNYVKIFDAASIEQLAYTDQEYGYLFLNILIKSLVTQNGIIAVNIIRALAFIVSYYAIFSLKEEINAGWSFIALGLMGYYPIFSMPAYMLASSLVLLAYSSYSKRKTIKALICLVVATSFHYTGLFMILPVLLYVLCFRKEYPQKVFILLLVGGTIVGVVFISSIYQYLINSIPFLYKYRIYSLYSSRMGIKQLVDYVPVFVCLYFDLKFKRKNRISNIALIMGIVGFAFGVAGYYIQNLTRIYTYFVFIFVVYFPMLIKQREDFRYKNSELRVGWIPLTIGSFKFVFLVYLAYRCVQFLSQAWYSSGFAYFHLL